jgi:hypothetical protein
MLEMDKIFRRKKNALEAIKTGNRTINKIFVSKTAQRTGQAIGEI